MVVKSEWLLIAIVSAAPFVLFGLIELSILKRRRKERALASRRKSHERLDVTRL